jgi:hypothetical protein
MNKSHNMSRRFMNISIAVELVVLSESSLRPHPTDLTEASAISIQLVARMAYGERTQAPLENDRLIDGWSLRDQFLSCSPKHWRSFIDAVGVPDAGMLGEKEFGKWQGVIREAMVKPPSEWRSLAARFDPGVAYRLFGELPLRFQWEPIPVAKVRTGSPLQAIIATIQLDVLAGSQFRYCKRNDCTAPPFKLESRHERVYCSSDCAHLVAVRNSRARVKKPKIPKRRNAKES